MMEVLALLREIGVDPIEHCNQQVHEHDQVQYEEDRQKDYSEIVSRSSRCLVFIDVIEIEFSKGRRE